MNPKANYPLMGLYLLLFTALANILPTPTEVRTPASLSGSMTCNEIVKLLLDPKTKVVRDSIERFDLSFKYQKKYTELFLESDLNKEELQVLLRSLDHLPQDQKSLDLLDEYFGFTATQFNKQKVKTLGEASALFDGSYLKNSKFKTFRNRQRKFASFEEKAIKKELDKIRKDQPDLSQAEAKRLAQKAAKEEASKFKKLYRGCHTKGMTQEHKAGGKAFTYFTISIAAASSGAFYTYSNYDDPEFLTKEFFGKMTYEMVGDGLWAALASWIFKDPKGTFLAKSAKMYLADNVLIMADGLTWEQLFAEGEEDAKKRIEELKTNPEFKEEMHKLVKILEREKFMDKVSKKFGEVLIQLKLKDPQDQGIDWEGIELEDLEDPEVQNQLMKAALMEMYEDESGELSLGTYGSDRWGFYSGLGLPFMFLDTLVTTKIYHTMCMAPMNPKAAIMKSALIFTAYSIFYDTIAYPMRKKLIGE
ncbi:MAG: hypothetical protein ACJAT2_001482 [Bacteriovoracaceae bacterium]|jgi:hypothetical protein